MSSQQQLQQPQGGGGGGSGLGGAAGAAVASSSTASALLGGHGAVNAIGEEEKKFVAEEDLLLLNVGGVKFAASKKTLTRYPGTLPAAMFSEENLKKFKPDKNGYYFVDRNGDAFESVLEFLRTGKLLHESKKVSAQVIREELRHWRVAPELVELIDPSPSLSMGDRYRARTMAAMLREGRIYIDHFMRYLAAEMDMAASLGKSQVYMLLGDPDAAAASPSSSSSRTSSSRRTSSGPGKGKAVHDGNLHKWLTLRRGHLTLVRQAIEREGLECQIATGLPKTDWIQIVVSWPLHPQELSGSYLWE